MIELFFIAFKLYTILGLRNYLSFVLIFMESGSLHLIKIDEFLIAYAGRPHSGKIVGFAYQ